MTTRRILLLTALSVAGVVALFAGAVAVFVLTEKSVPVTAADRAVVVDIQRLASTLTRFQPDPGAETFTKTRLIDGSYELEYEYEHPDDAAPLYLNCSVAVEPSASDARVSYSAMDFGMGAGLEMDGGGVIQEPADQLFRWGDKSKCAILKLDGEPVGHYLLVRAGRRVFALTFTGAHFEDREAFASLVLPVLERLKSYKP